MNVTAYIVTAWVVTFGSVAAYAGFIIRRGRALSKVVPPDERRWM